MPKRCHFASRPAFANVTMHWPTQRRTMRTRTHKQKQTYEHKNHGAKETTLNLPVEETRMSSSDATVSHRLYAQESTRNLPARTRKSGGSTMEWWAWNEMKSLPSAWFSGLAILLNMVETPLLWVSAPFVFWLLFMGFLQACPPQGLGPGLGSSVCLLS